MAQPAPLRIAAPARRDMLHCAIVHHHAPCAAALLRAHACESYPRGLIRSLFYLSLIRVGGKEDRQQRDGEDSDAGDEGNGRASHRPQG